MIRFFPSQLQYNMHDLLHGTPIQVLYKFIDLLDCTLVWHGNKDRLIRIAHHTDNLTQPVQWWQLKYP